MPLKSGEGRYVADADTLDRLEGDGRVVGLMPHPEHAIDPLTGRTDDGLGPVPVRPGHSAQRGPAMTGERDRRRSWWFHETWGYWSP